jgi:3-hydroxyisobutyrate dehydrogenase
VNDPLPSGDVVDPATTRVGWIGTGIMGAAMCGHVLDAGYQTTVYNRTPEKAADLVSRGAAVASSPAAVAAESDVVFTMVGYPTDVRAVILDPEGVLSGCSGGEIVADMTTSEPALATEIAEAAAALDVSSIDAPVSGGEVGALEARLSIMIGGDTAAVAALDPIWELLGTTIVHQGGPSAGQHTKMVNQTLIASNMLGVCEALLYAHAAGLDLDTVLASVSSGAAGSWSLSNLAPRMAAGDFAPGFYVEHFIKDMDIALAEATRMGLELPGLDLARELYGRLAEAGHGRLGTQSLLLTYDPGWTRSAP